MQFEDIIDDYLLERVSYNDKDCFYEENYETLKKIRKNKERFL